MLFSLKAIIELYSLFSKENIAPKIVGILSLAKPEVHGDISDNRTNLKDFLINILSCQGGCMQLNNEMSLALISRSGVPDVCISLEMDDEFYDIVEDETLEILEGIYNRAIINLDDELKLQNFFRHKKFHSSYQTEGNDDNKDHKELKEQLALANDYITKLTQEKSALTEEYHEKQGVMILQLKEMKRELKEEKKKKNKLFHVAHESQAQIPIDSSCQPNHHAISPRINMNRTKLIPIKAKVKLPILQSLLENDQLNSKHVALV